MTQKIITPTPQKYWELYSKELNDEGENAGTFKKYKDSKEWTKIVTKVAGKVHTGLGLKSSTEYFKVDVIGYTTKWIERKPVKTRPRKKQQHDWRLMVAYEHENTDGWDDELCKLCHVVADLRVISSYYNPRKIKSIEIELHQKVRKLGFWRMHRVPNSSWLFVFGKMGCYKEPFRAFTLDAQLNVVDITDGGVRVVPGQWK